ncbi:LysM peptidoglycan-binding domain-containing protein [bacterium]|nr:LysM peptidoglycan-binding domain-containing protein [bacterium]
MAVLETLSKYKGDMFDDSPSVYVRPVDKEKELDILWQNFKVNQKQSKSPNVYLVTGFVMGAVVMLIMAILVSFSLKGINTVKENSVLPVKKEKMSLNFIPSTAVEKPNSEVYEVQSGDTMESIIIRFYGSYSKEKEALILQANDMTNPNKLGIGQILTIPVGE